LNVPFLRIVKDFAVSISFDVAVATFYLDSYVSSSSLSISVYRLNMGIDSKIVYWLLPK